jgi:ABC-type transporter Mla MlaB component
MGLSLVRLLWNLSRLEIRLDHDPAARQATLRLSGTASFLGAPRLARMLDQLPPGTRLQVEVDGLSYVDHACMELLANWVRQNEGKGAASAVPWDALHSRHPARGAMVPTAS